jgi:glycosyltransferase involved in cell wall biosynthesis
MDDKKLKLFIIDSEDWTFWFHRLSLAMTAIESGFEVTLLTKANKYTKQIEEKGIRVVNIDFVRSSKSPLKDVLNVLKLRRIFKKEKPDIIHNVALKTMLISSFAAFSLKKTVVINALTGLGYVFSSEQIQAKLIRFFIKPVLTVITKRNNFWTIFQNPDDMGLFVEQGLVVPERSVLIRGSGVDVDEFLQTEDTNKIPVVMLASRMLWDKGIGEFVAAAKRARENNIEAKFILVGDTDADNPMSIPASQLELWAREGCIEWSGHKTNMPEMLSSASIVCLPSYREGLPKVLLEAAAVGRPLISTDVPGCREIIRNGENGILVKLKDVDSLYEAIRTLILNEELRLEMGNKSRVLVEKELSTDIINRQTLELYKATWNSIH